MILFYLPSDEYGIFCNFSAHGFNLDHHYWPTVEHYFQAMKFIGTAHAEQIRVAATPREVKTLIAIAISVHCFV